jgi:hypothetical protein
MRNDLRFLRRVESLIGIVPLNKIHKSITFTDANNRRINYTKKQIMKVILDNNKFFNRGVIGVSLGSKQEPYFTEDEMLNKPIYDYGSLSVEEKKIYKSIQ